MTLPSQRDLFDIPRDLCYLNAAYMTPFPTDFAAVAEAALQEGMRPWTVQPEDFFTATERVRALAARVFDAPADAIAIVPAVSYGVAVAAANLPVATGQVILTIAEEFPSNHYGWARLAAERGARLEMVPGPAERDWTAALLARIEALGDRLALLAVPHVHWSTGAMLDLVALRAATKRVGAALFLDLTQSLGALPISMRDIDPDFAVAAGYKWLLGPYALGYLYVSPRWRDGRPLEENWILRKNSEDFSRLVDYQPDYQPGARRFDMGERSNFLLMPLAEAALELVLKWSVPEIAASLKAINDRLAAFLEEWDFEITPGGWRAPHLMAARHRRLASGPLAADWKQQGVAVSVRGDWIRIAPHLWIDGQDEAHFRKIAHKALG